METSAKTAINVEDVYNLKYLSQTFRVSAQQIYQKIIDGIIDLSNEVDEK